MMRLFDNGSLYTVQVSRRDVSVFKSQYPCSGIPDVAIRFQFDKANGDLIDLTCRTDTHTFDGQALAALSQDAQTYGRNWFRSHYITHEDGESGVELVSFSQECAIHCSVPGQPADEAVAYWRNKAVWHAGITELRRSLKGYGAWDDLETADYATLQDRVLWLAAGDWRERQQARGRKV